MRIGIVGAGDMGHALAVLLITLGHCVEPSHVSRRPRLEAMVQALGPSAGAGTVVTVSSGDSDPGGIVFLAIL